MTKQRVVEELYSAMLPFCQRMTKVAFFLQSAEAEQSAIEKNYHTVANSKLGYYLIFNHFRCGTNQTVIVFITLRFFKKHGYYLVPGRK